MKILIDNGHGIDTPGKCSPDASNGLKNSPLYFREYEWARKCAQGIVSVLKFEGYDAELLVPEDKDISLDERVRRANKVKDAILVSVHVNAAKSDRQWHDAQGWCVYTTPGKTKADDLATCIHAVAVTELEKVGYTKKFKNGGKQKPIRTDYTDGDPDIESAFYILRHTSCPAVLTENLFQDNKDDVEFLKSDAGLGAMIHIHVQGIEDYIAKYGKK